MYIFVLWKYYHLRIDLSSVFCKQKALFVPFYETSPEPQNSAKKHALLFIRNKKAGIFVPA